MNTSKWRRIATTAVGCTALVASAASAGHRRAACNCQSGGVPAVSGPSSEMFEQYGYGFAAGAGASSFVTGVRVLPPPAPLPPGTLGYTYQRPSRPVPAAKHPRAGMLDVCAPGATAVSVQWTHPYKLEDELEGFVDAEDASLFHFESPQLIPGVPQIYRVEARYGVEGDYTVKEKYVRLIMGRVVNVTM